MSLVRTSLLALVVVAAACGTDGEKETNNTTGSNNVSTGNNTSTGTNNVSTGNNVSTVNNTSTGTNNATATNNASTNNTTGTNNATNNGTTPAPMCAGDTPTECFTNADCPDEQRCEDASGGVGEPMPCCVVGARGAKVTGDLCSSENECASGVCIARNDSPAICSQACQGPDDCPGDLECNGVLALCVTPG